MTTPYHPPVKHSIRIDGHRTSISLEPVFWDLLRAAAARRGVAVSALVAMIDAERIRSETPPGLAGAIRVWLATHELTPGNQKGDEIASAAPSNSVDRAP
ncbi:ribbon-helix-helix domain-containing protein [Qipengyuania aurantiaca]|uniref:Ribbon-helix-helix domain-containing protein n=1 Tax=Qipengyuania aurantiaca TaxID=2867233 RepID=A0ABX8ZQH3_9SPHN|nr:ribbon-helix-helix domain-containing protein [Qipengyuania aurantiaca]QZD91182.1 ribbon-helix-helix domain-containing protein [Qipengyuania aurantiaca]